MTTPHESFGTICARHVGEIVSLSATFGTALAVDKSNGLTSPHLYLMYADAMRSTLRRHLREIKAFEEAENEEIENANQEHTL